jgi:hypothetical protein
MTRYQFALRRNDDSVALETSMALENLAAAWTKVGELAHRGAEKDGRILVKDDEGEVVILVGLASARALAPAPKDKWSVPFAVQS